MVEDRWFLAAWWTGWSALLGLFEAVVVFEWQLDQHAPEEPKEWVIPLAIAGVCLVVMLGIVFGFRVSARPARRRARVRLRTEACPATLVPQ